VGGVRGGDLPLDVEREEDFRKKVLNYSPPSSRRFAIREDFYSRGITCKR